MSDDPVPYTVAPAAPTLHPWLAPFRPPDRPMIRAWFSYCLSQGARQPETIVDMVQRVVAAKLDWSVSPTSIALCEATLAALAHRRGEALSYATTLLTGRGDTG
jgi:hypothetical protein